MSGIRNLRKLLKIYIERGISMKVIKKPPQFDAIQYNGNNKEQLEKLFDYLVPGVFIVDQLDIGDWVIVHGDGQYEIVCDKSFDKFFERV